MRNGGHLVFMASPVGYVTVGNTSISVEIARTEAAREAGLSGRTSLAPNTGMLFVFESEEVRGFWMKDMRFSLDIIWADASGTIVTILSDVTPQTYPKIFYPSAPATYVLEVPAGFAKSHGIAEGAKMTF
jgi:hypothetical protein